jgi:hypothetical protein
MIDQDGDSALALKENQGTMYEDVSETFALALADQFPWLNRSRIAPWRRGMAAEGSARSGP